MSHQLVTAFASDDLEAVPVDGRRYELIGGAIVVTPAPEPAHQRALRRLFRMLDDACPPGHEVFCAPIDYDLPDGQRVQPDLVVVPESGIGQKRLSGPALLVVEIVSPGSRTNDHVTKRAAYAEAGVAAYWVVDPNRRQMTALRLTAEGNYEPYAEPADEVRLDWPLRVSFRVSDLVRRSR